METAALPQLEALSLGLMAQTRRDESSGGMSQAAGEVRDSGTGLAEETPEQLVEDTDPVAAVLSYQSQLGVSPLEPTRQPNSHLDKPLALLPAQSRHHSQSA